MLFALTILSILVWILLVSKLTRTRNRYEPTNYNFKENWLTRNFDIQSYIEKVSMKHNLNNDDIRKIFNVSSNGKDVIVFLRVQKTGSTTLSRHFSLDLDLQPECNCSSSIRRCPCLQEWKLKVLFRPSEVDNTCFVHASYARLLPCVDRMMDERNNISLKRRHLYITMIRDPFRRYLSEWMYVNQHGQWGFGPKDCKYSTTSWKWANVTLEQFMKCPSNPAISRQTHMIGVENPEYEYMPKEYRDKDLLKSALNNVKSFAYFGITEFQELSQILFENTFNIKFRSQFETLTQKADRKIDTITEAQRWKIVTINKLDMKFYEYAKDLFRLRILNLFERTKNVTLKKTLNVLSYPLFENILQ